MFDWLGVRAIRTAECVICTAECWAEHAVAVKFRAVHRTNYEECERVRAECEHVHAEFSGVRAECERVHAEFWR